MKKTVFTLFILCFSTVSVSLGTAPGDTLWTRVIGGVYNDAAFEIQETTDEGFIVVGYSYSFGPGNYDVYLVKTDADGDTMWTRTYGGAADGDYGTSVKQTTDGGYIVAGYSESFGPGGYGGYLVKTDAVGDTLWTKSFGGSGYDHIHCVQQTADSGYVVTGRTNSFSENEDYDLYLVKTDTEGDTLWTRTYGGSDWDEGYTVQQTSDGGYIVVGHTVSFGGGNEDIWLVKTDASGDTLWTKTYGGGLALVARSVEQTTDGGYIIGGQTDPWGGSADVLLIKTDDAGSIEWAHLYGWDGDQMPNQVHQTDDGGYIFAGYGWMGGDGWYDIYVGKTDANGSLEWSGTYGGAQDEHAMSVIQAGDGSFVVAGDTRSYGMGAADFYILKLAGEQPTPDVSITMIPDDDPPVPVPPGGSFGFTGTLINHSGLPATLDVWTMAIGPPVSFSVGPFLQFNDVQIAGNDTISGHVNQDVPGAAPPISFNYVLYCGDYPSTVFDSSFFQVDVTQDSIPGGGDGKHLSLQDSEFEVFLHKDSSEETGCFHESR